MISPSPTQQPPGLQPEPKNSTPVRPGQSPVARRTKKIFKPILRGMYYGVTWIQRHILWAILVILLVGASSYATAYVATQGFDPLHEIAAHDQGSANHIRAWLDALRAGNASKLNALQSDMLQTKVQPDTASLVSQYGQPQTGNMWVSISILGVHGAADPTLESFIEVDLAGPGQGNTASSILIVHFTTVSAAQGRIFAIDILTPRQFIHLM